MRQKWTRLFAENLYTEKNDTDVAHYNLDVDQPILIIFGM